jgi:NAD(P)-dependent dehydrogenase (short-subunit alcohol dehydrogenase family)
VSRTVVVTGGARGIGDAIARSFREVGDGVVSLDLLRPDEARDGVRYLEADVSNPAAVQGALEGIEPVHVLVNNAGIQRVGLTGKLPVEDWLRVLEINLTGAFVCASAAVPRMMRGGAIVSIASTAAFVGLPGRGPYSAAKAGLVGWTRALAMELAPRGIRANAVAPGFTRTKLVEQALRDGSLREEWMVERVPLGRLAEPDEIARVVRFLASEEASYITGQTIVVDGGWTIQGIGAAPGWLA